MGGLGTTSCYEYATRENGWYLRGSNGGELYKQEYFMSVEEDLLQAAREVHMPTENEILQSVIASSAIEIGKTCEGIKQMLESGKYSYLKLDM